MERASFELCTRLLQRGWSITVIARSCALPPQPGLRFVRLRSPSRPVSAALASDLVLGSLAARRHATGLVQTDNPIIATRVDVIRAHFCERAYRERVGINRSRRADPLYRLNSWIAGAISLLCERWSYRPGRARAVVAVSQGLAGELGGFYPRVRDVVRTLPNGVDCGAFRAAAARRDAVRAELGIADGERLALFVGGDWHRKGLRYAIEGVAAAPGWRLAVAGDGDRAGFVQLAADYGIGDRVSFLGKVAKPHGLYAAADALTFPSHYEAFSLVTLEAAAAGLPLLVARINGTDELVEDGVNGWFVERDGATIGARLRELGDDPARHDAMRAAARRSAERYDWERVTDDFERLYRDVLT
ncbi:MAG TPA: glycosyltransferase family 4 protein [Baekduia sp.]|nr:glycosyltransferase family 4 protein [Baekduia sp.]